MGQASVICGICCRKTVRGLEAGLVGTVTSASIWRPMA